MGKKQPSRSRPNFSLLHIDLEKKHPNHGKERRMRVRERESTSCGAHLQQIQGQNLSPRKWPLFRVLRFKPQEWRSHGEEG
jgi:hypothetical protein